MTTVKEIAGIVGVSAAAVSRVLSRDPSFKISRNLRTAIIDAAESLNYQSPKMRALRASRLVGSSETILIAMREFDGRAPHVAHQCNIRVGIERRCVALGLRTTVILLQDLRDIARSSGIAGVVVIGGLFPDEVEHVASAGVPVVISDWQQNDGRFDCVYADFSTAVTAVLNNVLLLERKDVRYLCASRRDLRMQLISAEIHLHAHVRSFEQFTEPFQTAGSRFAHTVSPFEVGYKQVNEILKSGARPDIIFVEDDDLGVGAYRALKEAGLIPGLDVDVISLCATDLGAFQSPPLTSIEGRGLAVGENAVDVLLSRIKGRTIARDVVLFAEVSQLDLSSR